MSRSARFWVGLGRKQKWKEKKNRMPPAALRSLFEHISFAGTRLPISIGMHD